MKELQEVLARLNAEVEYMDKLIAIARTRTQIQKRTSCKTGYLCAIDIVKEKLDEIHNKEA